MNEVIDLNGRAKVSFSRGGNFISLHGNSSSSNRERAFPT